MTVRIAPKEFSITRILIAFCGFAAAAQAQSQVVSAGYTIPTYPAVAPGQIVTLFVRGLNAPDAFATVMPLPTALSGIVVKVKTSIPKYPESLPILSVRSYDSLTHVTVQIPTEPTCVPTGQFPNECAMGPSSVITLNVQLNGVGGQDFPVVVSGPEPHIIDACDTIFGTIGGICNSLVTHADGSLVGSGCANPVKPGETIVLYAVGLGPTDPFVKTGDPAPAPAKAVLVPSFILSYRVNLLPGSPAPPVVWSPIGNWVNPEYVGLVQGYVGLYQINVKVPAPASQDLLSNGYATLRIALGAGSSTSHADGSTFADVCVQAQ